MVKYAFSSWGGDVTGNLNPITFEMPSIDIVLIANYSSVTHKLTFTSTPINVQINVKIGANAPVPLNSGQSIDVPEEETVEVTAPDMVVA